MSWKRRAMTPEQAARAEALQAARDLLNQTHPEPADLIGLASWIVATTPTEQEEPQ